jgi:bifunctional polynucleotide phosphatase/kinase
MQVFVASHEDEYRKPGAKMWDCLVDNNGGVKIIKEKSFFCGDAAGRKNGKIKDFSDSDLKFALNVGIEFKTPENLFLGEVDVIEVKGFNPATISEAGEVLVGKGNKIDFV